MCRNPGHGPQPKPSLNLHMDPNPNPGLSYSLNRNPTANPTADPNPSPSTNADQDGQPHDPDSPTWGPSPWLLEQSFSVRYLHSFLWGFGMMTTQLPYDVVPSTPLEVATTVFSLLIALLIATLSVSTITSVHLQHC